MLESCRCPCCREKTAQVDRDDESGETLYWFDCTACKASGWWTFYADGECEVGTTTTITLVEKKDTP
jgi:hypothetical protein